MNIQTKKKLLWAVLFSIAFTGILLYRVEWDHFSLIVGRLDMQTLFAAYCVYLLSNLVRAFRFYKLDHMDKKMAHWWYISAFYNFITATLPGGSGEASTAYILKRFSEYNILGALRILLFSRLMDAFALSVLFFITALFMSSDTSYREAAIWISGALFFISTVTLLPSSEQFVMRLLGRLPERYKLVKLIKEKLSEVITISEEQRSNNTFGISLFQSLVMWAGGIVLLHLVLRSLGVDFTIIQSAYCFGVYAVFQIIPIQGIAGIGTQAAWWTLALKVTGYDDPDIIALGFVLYGIYYIFVAAMGLLSLLFWMKGKEKR